MTLKQLQYIVTVAEEGNITNAAKKLFIAQPSLTSAIHELENEYNITIFMRSNKGIKLTSEGEEFLGYARQVLDQTELIEERYAGKGYGKLKFFVSSQHYSFAVEAFVEQFRCLERAHVQVFRDGQAGEDVFGLRHEADATGDEFVGAQVGDVLAFQQQLAGVDVHQAEQ